MEKTLAVHLKELREEIAKDIERHIPHGDMCDITMIYLQAVAIVRGKYK